MNSQLPCYRKYKDRQHYFKVLSDWHFQEIKQIGDNYEMQYVEAKFFPDKIFIQHMVDNKDNHWEEITAEEYDEKLAYCQENLTLLD